MNSHPSDNLYFSEDFLVRIALIFAGGFLLAEGLQNWIRGRLVTHPQVVLLNILTYALALSLLALSMIKSKSTFRMRDLAFASLIFITVTSWYVITQVEFPGSYQTDTLAFSHYSAILLNNGLNPYAQDLESALGRFAVNPQFFTLTPQGNMITNLDYPALQVLILLPAVWLRLSDARIVPFVFELASIFLIYFWAPRQIRSVVLIPLYAGSDLAINFTAGSLTEFFWVLPLLVMIIFLDNPWISGITFGLACAIKQTPWLVAPFLLVWFYRRSDPARRVRRLTEFTSLSLVAFLVPNALFIWENLNAWYAGVVTPIFGQLVVLSQGLSLMTSGAGVPLPGSFYFIAMLAVYVTLLVNYFIYFDKLAYTIWALPAITYWFSYRGLQNYFIFWIPLILMTAVLLYRRHTPNA